MEAINSTPPTREEIKNERYDIQKRLDQLREKLNQKYQEAVAEHPVFGEMQAQRIAMEESGLESERYFFTTLQVNMFTELVNSFELYMQMNEVDPEILELNELRRKLSQRRTELDNLLQNNLEFILEKAHALIRKIKSRIRRLQRENKNQDLDTHKIKRNEAWIQLLEAALEEYQALVGEEC